MLKVVLPSFSVGRPLLVTGFRVYRRIIDDNRSVVHVVRIVTEARGQGVRSLLRVTDTHVDDLMTAKRVLLCGCPIRVLLPCQLLFGFRGASVGRRIKFCAMNDTVMISTEDH